MQLTHVLLSMPLLLAIAVTQSIPPATGSSFIGRNIRRAGTQFITGVCTSDADCASGCCAFNTGKCAGAIVALERDGGCGFGSGTPNTNAADALTGTKHTITSASKGSSGSSSSSGSNSSSSSGSSNSGSSSNTGSTGAAGTQFITGACTSDANCASGCCAFNTGKCAGAVVALERDGGCGFGNSQPNTNAADKLTGTTHTITSPSTGKAGTGGSSSSSSSGTATGSNRDSGSGTAITSNTKPSTTASTAAASSGNGSQFITGTCSSDADCASACCGFNTGKCAGPVIAQERDGGCGFGDGQPNDTAAQAFRNGQKRDPGMGSWMKE